MAKKRAGGDASDDLVDALYAASPRAFVGERKRVVAALAAAGRDDEARAAAKLKRPSASVWAVNQLARREPHALAELLDLGATLRSEERKLMRGGSAAGFMTDARTARQKVASLTKRAEALIEEAGQKATATLGRKIAQTLHAASIADDDTRARLQAGRLQDDLAAPSSFGSAGDLATTLAASLGATSNKRASAHEPARQERKQAEHTSAAHKSAAPAAAEREQAAAARKRAAAALRDQRRAQAAARKQAAALERAAVAAERVVAERARAVEKARAAVEHAESQLRAAKDELVYAETAAAAARRAADDAS